MNQLGLNDYKTKLLSFEYSIPHTGAMNFQGRVKQYIEEPDFCGVCFKLSKHHYYFRNGVFQNHWLIELAAQAVAAHIFLRTKRSQCKIGFLSKIESFQMLSNNTIKEDQYLDVDSEVTFEMDGFAKHSILIKEASPDLDHKSEAHNYQKPIAKLDLLVIEADKETLYA